MLKCDSYCICVVVIIREIPSCPGTLKTRSTGVSIMGKGKLYVWLSQGEETYFQITQIYWLSPQSHSTGSNKDLTFCELLRYIIYQFCVGKWSKWLQNLSLKCIIPSAPCVHSYTKSFKTPCWKRNYCSKQLPCYGIFKIWIQTLQLSHPPTKCSKRMWFTQRLQKLDNSGILSLIVFLSNCDIVS